MAGTELFLLGGLIVWIYVTLIWFLSLIKKDAGIMDIFWGLGFVVLAFVYLIQGGGQSPHSLLLFVLVLIWGLRLSLHIGERNLGEPEDARYANWRKENGPRWWWLSYFKVFMLQGVFMWIISIPLLVGLKDAASLNALDYIGLLLFAVGFFFEAVGDWQLRRFKKTPGNKGKVLDSGLWGMTRHPNYFGEAVLWWGMSLMAVQVQSLWILISPIIMTWLLVKVSGVKMLDELLLKTKPEYARYIKEVNPFIPGKRA